MVWCSTAVTKFSIDAHSLGIIEPTPFETSAKEETWMQERFDPFESLVLTEHPCVAPTGPKL
jgi:hypothetical protein